MNANPNAYWSPATKQETGQKQTQLSSNAPSFNYPNSSNPSSGISFEDQASMNLAAAEFVPSRGSAPNPVGSPNGSNNESSALGNNYYNQEGGHDAGLNPSEFIPGSDGEELFEDHVVSSTPHDVDWTQGTSHTQCVVPAWRAAPMLQMNQNLRQHFHSQTIELLRCLEPNDERYKEIPPRFHSIFPLDHSSKSRSSTGSFGYPSAVFKVVQDNVCYALRRIDNARPTTKVVQTVMGQWSSFRHPNIVALHECFSHKGSLYFQYAYWPTAQTLADRFVGSGAPADESLLWSYLCQLCTAIKQVHANKSALRCVSAAHILLTSGNRVRISGVGVIDVLEHDQVITLADKQRDDIMKLGTCLLTVASRCFVTNQNVSQCLASLQHTYSPDFQRLVSTLIYQTPDIISLCSSISSHLVNELSMSYAIADGLESHLSNEYNNGRLLKLLLKLGYVCDDNLEDMGDRYMLKLFRDYLFRQVNEVGQQVVDVGHVVYSLNRLDVGDEAQLLLASPDESTVLVVTFADLKICLQNAFMALASTTQTGGYEDDLDMATQKLSLLERIHGMSGMPLPPTPPPPPYPNSQYHQGGGYPADYGSRPPMMDPNQGNASSPTGGSLVSIGNNMHGAYGAGGNGGLDPYSSGFIPSGGGQGKGHQGKNRVSGSGKGKKGGRRNH